MSIIRSSNPITGIYSIYTLIGIKYLHTLIGLKGGYTKFGCIYITVYTQTNCFTSAGMGGDMVGGGGSFGWGLGTCGPWNHPLIERRVFIE